MVVPDVGLPVLAAVLVGWLARSRLKLTAGRAAVASLLSTLLTWILVSELTLATLRAFWQRHPSWDATVRGLILLGLTALIVERALELKVEQDRDRRWKPAARVACEAVLLAVAEPIRAQRADIFWRSSDADGYRSEGRRFIHQPTSGPAMRQAMQPWM